MRENVLVAEALLWLSAQPETLVWRNNVGFARDPSTGRAVRFGLPGAADIIGCARGRFFAVELKSDRGRQSDEQRAFQQAVERAGGVYALCRSLEEVKQAWQLARTLPRAA